MSVDTIKARKNRRFWREFLSKSHNQRTNFQWANARDLAFNWDTCACGSVNDGLNRDPTDMPYDPDLRKLGEVFYFAITDHDLPRSRRIFNKIQIRAGKVLDKQIKRMTWE